MAEFDQLMPPSYSRYYEPFLGGGAAFFKIAPSRATLSDLNQDLINAYQVVRDNPGDLLERLLRAADLHSKEYYYDVRAHEPDDPLGRAVRFIYLNRTCWNGLYRVNRGGKFNVPIGTKTAVVMPGDDFLAVSRRLKDVSLRCCDFARTIASARTGDFIYCDPPYTVAHNNNGFVKYNESIFTWRDQQRLLKSLVSAERRGVMFAVSNANHASIKELYKGYRLQELCRASVISGGIKGRGGYAEVFITNY